jgi:hypothetical protein
MPFAHMFEAADFDEKICGYRPHDTSPECGYPASNRSVHAPGVLPGPRLLALPIIRKDHAAVADGARATSVAAAALARMRRGTKRMRIVEMLTHPGASAQGLTCDEIETVTGWTHQSASSAYVDLARDHIIREALDEDGKPVTRPTASGSHAQAWVLTDEGAAAYRAERTGMAS